ncbi:MAG: ribonuclease H family protein [Muribaculaceae bacterium]|nr:ribonuclease H family protein [Muribaculaceae bacterium]MDE6331146.1 ribonuclease H family protein [Muribaculaceae bacterium]
MSTPPSNKRKFYVVWHGLSPGIYDSWEECKAQIEGVRGARYKSFSSVEEATEAYRGDPQEYMGLYRAMAARKPQIINYEAFPEIRLDAWSVDGACAKNPGPMEYRCVEVGTGNEVFHLGPLDDGTNNIAEYLALIHAAALLARNGDTTRPIYSDSRTALSWLRRGKSNTKLEATGRNQRVFELLQRADAWLASHRILNPILKWDTEKWGEIPADFGRK